MTAAKTPRIEEWDVGNLVPYELNSKKHPPEQVARIAKSIKEFGYDTPIVVDKNGVIIKGHGRRLALIELGIKRVLVLVRDDLNEEAVRAARLADNRAAQGDIDTEVLRRELSQFNDSLPALLDGIFDIKEIDFSMADLGSVDPSAFETDMGAVLDDQAAALAGHVEHAKAGRLTVARAFGFKDIPAAGGKAINKLMVAAERATGLKGGEALIAYSETLA